MVYKTLRRRIAIAGLATAALALTAHPASALADQGASASISYGSTSTSKAKPHETPKRTFFHTNSHVHRMPVYGKASPDTAAPSYSSGDGSNLSYQGGRVIERPKVYLVFWVPSGKSLGASYKSLLPRFVRDVGATRLAAVMQQYPSSLGPPRPGISLGGAWTDTTAYPNSRGTATNPLLDTDIQDEMYYAAGQNSTWTRPGHSAIYVIATARGIKSCLDSTHASCSFAGVGTGAANYCGYHSVSANGSGGVYINLPDSNNATSTGCSLGNSGLTAPNNGEADWEIKVFSHELFETMSDPDPNVSGALASWVDDQGEEVADKCNNDFPGITNNANLVVGTHRYLVQSEWSNAISDCSLSYSAVVDGHAVRPGFAQNTLPGNDDGSAPLADLGFVVQMGGNTYTQAYVNNNGNLTFDGPSATYTPYDLATSTGPIIAPFFADVDTRPGQAPPVAYGQGTVNGHLAFAVTWRSIGYYSQQADKLNRFQVVLIDRSDVAAGDFDVEFNYDQVLWETGDASGGSRGLGGTPAVAGVGLGSGFGANELPGSGQSRAFEDWGTSPLAAGDGGGVVGRWLTQLRGGIFFT